MEFMLRLEQKLVRAMSAKKKFSTRSSRSRRRRQRNGTAALRHNHPPLQPPTPPLRRRSGWRRWWRLLLQPQRGLSRRWRWAAARGAGFHEMDGSGGTDVDDDYGEIETR